MRQGRFSWRELATAEPDAALAFYRAVVGWSSRPAPHPGYTIVQAGDWGVGGITGLDQGVQPGWTGYVEVADVQAAADRALALGGRVLGGPTEIPGVIQRATIADPEGALFVVSRNLRPLSADSPKEPEPEAPGLFGWAEIVAHAWPRLFDFYAGMFGWTRSFAFTLGPIGTYQVFAQGGRDIGGMMNGNARFPAVYWGHYVQVDGARAAVDRVRAAGGTVVNGPHEAPGERWAAQARDPQGHIFGLLSRRP
jgi:predicted enzyme related to lactoylglutathione lyase